VKVIAVSLLLAGIAGLGPFGLEADMRDPDRGFDVEEIAPGVHAVIRREPVGLVPRANNVFIVNDEDVMVVDTSQSPAATADVLAALRRITARPVRYVINTHGQDDHVLGNAVYRDAYKGVEIIGQVSMLARAGDGRSAVPALPVGFERAAAAMRLGLDLNGLPLAGDERRAYERDVEWGGRYLREAPRTTPVPPTIPVTSRLTLHRGARTIEILSLGGGHSPSDLVVFLPEERVLVAGDLVGWPVPRADDESSIAGWLRALDGIRALDARVIVPGHGPLLRERRPVDRLREMLADIGGQVRALAPGRTLEDVRRAIRLDQWREEAAGGSALRAFLFDTEVTGRIVAAAYREASSN
jgi:cyclase